MKYCLVEKTVNMVRYKYFPEGRASFGVVSYCDGQICIEMLADNDRHEIYAFHFIKKIKEMVLGGAWEETGVVAWY